MNKNTKPIIKKKRIDVVDALRGFAIMGIMLLHSIEHFNLYVFPDKNLQSDWLINLDQKIWDSLFFLFGGKGYAIFAILFGFTFSLMYAKQRSRNLDFGYRFLWRMLLLAGFAFFNGLFFPGEVLLMYSIVGVVLFVVRNWSMNAQMAACVFFLLQPIEWGHYLLSLLNSNYELPSSNMGYYWGLVNEGQQNESFLFLIKSNTLYGHKASLLWAYDVGRLIQTAGLFILGYLLGKAGRFLPTDVNLKFWKQILIIASIVFIPLWVLEENFVKLMPLDIHKKTIFKIVDMYGNLALTFVLIAMFILLYQKNRFKKLTNGLRFCGKMSLTAYVFQSIIGGFVFYEYGLGLAPHLGITASLGVGILLFILQVYICKWWLKSHRRGPLENIWHKLTWINLKPK